MPVSQRQAVAAQFEPPVCAAVTPDVPNAPPLVRGAATALTAWVAGFVFTLARAVLACRSVNRLYTRSKRLPAALVPPYLPRFARRVLGDDPAVPITWGVRKPVVLLPVSAQEWDSSLRAAAILHELAHVRRLDNLTQLFALFTCAVH
jgi:beta-lactamase regulating signal transducer with metallopeptidase domain